MPRHLGRRVAGHNRGPAAAHLHAHDIGVGGAHRVGAHLVQVHAVARRRGDHDARDRVARLGAERDHVLLHVDAAAGLHPDPVAAQAQRVVVHVEWVGHGIGCRVGEQVATDAVAEACARGGDRILGDAARGVGREQGAGRVTHPDPQRVLGVLVVLHIDRAR